MQPNLTCASVEFMPLEYWHVRHLQGAGHRDGKSQCRPSNAFTAVLLQNGTRRRVQSEAQPAAFPRQWAREYAWALGNLTADAENDT